MGILIFIKYGKSWKVSLLFNHSKRETIICAAETKLVRKTTAMSNHEPQSPNSKAAEQS